MADSGVRYDRRVSAAFLSHFLDDGVAAHLPQLAKYARYPVDFQLRKDVKSGAEHATLYVGLTAVLRVKQDKKGSLSLHAHPTHQKNGGFDAAWKKPRSGEALAEIWGEVEAYLERIVPMATLSHGHKEGAVQAALSSYPDTTLAILDREVTPSFKNQGSKKSFLETCQAPILEALEDGRLSFSGRPTRLGNECDALAVDAEGRVLAIEVKPLSGGRIPWVPAQAMMYARVLQGWIDEDGSEEGPAVVLRGMLEQRRALGLAPDVELGDDPLRVTPVVALQRGASDETIHRMKAVRDVLGEHDFGVEPLQIYEVTLMGRLVPLDETDSATVAARRRVLRGGHEPEADRMEGRDGGAARRGSRTGGGPQSSTRAGRGRVRAAPRLCRPQSLARGQGPGA